MNVLTIGNSFSKDATRYLNQIAKADGEDITVINLCIGGCSLETHYKNMLSDSKRYDLEIDGKRTAFYVSIQEALISRSWDYISLQQASHFSFDYETYQPYINELAAYIRKYSPKSKLIIHQTWAYEQGSQRLLETAGYTEHTNMFADIKYAYNKAAEDIGADTIIPSGELFQLLISSGIEKVHRDTAHARFGLGRYALGLLWYKMLTGNDVTGNTFCDFDEPVSPDEINIAKDCVTLTAEKYI